MTYGHCNACDRTQEDLEEHLTKVHHGKKPLDSELFSGTIECKVCRQMVETPRRKEGKWTEAPEHNCIPADTIKDPNTGRVIDITNDSGMDLRTQKIIIRPTGY